MFSFRSNSNKIKLNRNAIIIVLSWDQDHLQITQLNEKISSIHEKIAGIGKLIQNSVFFLIEIVKHTY